jgi:hypothetical protein
MNTQEMATTIMATARELKEGITFVDLTDACGESAKGDRQMTFPDHDHFVIWSGISTEFIDAFNSVKSQLKPQALNEIMAFLTYSWHGVIVKMPVIPHDREDVDPDVEYWVPLTFSLKVVETEEGAAF